LIAIAAKGWLDCKIAPRGRVVTCQTKKRGQRDGHTANGERSFVDTIYCVACASFALDTSFLSIAGSVLARCKACGSLTAVPRPKPDRQRELHDSKEYFHGAYLELRRQRKDAALMRARRALQFMSSAGALQSLTGLRHLDVGCDSGVFCRAMAGVAGTIPFGIDVSRRAVALAKADAIEAYAGTLEDAPSSFSGFTFITAIDLIEHVADPQSFLISAANRLAPNGLIYLETPNALSVVYGAGKLLTRLTGGKPQWVCERIFPPEHIQYFTAKGLELLAQRSGLAIVGLGSRVLPGPDIAASTAVQVAMSALQIVDRLTGRRILLRAALQHI
jgi:2-polyprenyl-6-hydroxyphenyl methylase/3-demethylubiquinone-9 3-methyltransferase